MSQVCNLGMESTIVGEPAASKVVRRLLPAGLVRKEQRPGNRKEVVFCLTAAGEEAVRDHETHRRRVFSPLVELEAKLPEAERARVLRVLRALYRELQARVG